MSCNPELVTGYVDDALEPAQRAEIEAHLAECAVCREQVAAERELRRRLMALPSPEPRRGFENEMRRAVQRARPSPLRVLLPIAAVLALAVLWGLRTPRVVAWELARDHRNCFGHESLPAEVWSDNGTVVGSWFEARGVPMPPLPDGAAGLTLVGGRRCPILDRTVVHLYYTGNDHTLSLFVVPGTVQLSGERFRDKARGQAVRLFRVAGATVGVVGEDADDVTAFERSFRSSEASLEPDASGLTAVAALW